MRLDLTWLRDVGNVNQWSYASTPQVYEGDTASLFFQIVDREAQLAAGVFRRYVPASGATLTLTLDSVEDARKVVRLPAQPFPTQDASIWRLDLSPADLIRGTIDVRLVLNEAGVVHNAVVKGALRILSTQRI